MAGSGLVASARFRIAVTLALIAALLIGQGCASPSATETVLRFWAMGREGEVVAQLLPEFEQANPGIRVKVQQLPWTAAHEKLLTAFAGGATPDLCQLGNTWIPELVALGALEPLDRSVAASAVVRSHEIFLPLTGLIDVDLERQRLLKEYERVVREFDVSRRKLSNVCVVFPSPRVTPVGKRAAISRRHVLFTCCHACA